MKRRNILSAAARLFAERGFNNTPTILLAQEAGVAEGTIFRHFKTKDEIFFVLIENVHAQLITELREMLAVRSFANGLEAVTALIRGFCIFVRRNPMEFTLVFRDASSRYGNPHDQAFLSIHSLYLEIGALVHEAVVKGQADGSIDPVLHAEDTAIQLVCQAIGFTRGMFFSLPMQERGESRILGHLLENVSRLLRPAA